MVTYTFEYDSNVPDHSPAASSENVVQHQVSTSAMTATSTQVQQRNLLPDLPGEILNRIFAYCKVFQVDIAYANNRDGFEGMLDGVRPNITDTFPDIYYTENTFVLDIRGMFEFHGKPKLDKIWKPWLANLSERHAGTIQHFRILTPAFSAVMHIPVDRNEVITVKLRVYERNWEAVEVEAMIDWFNEKLRRLNARLRGQRLTKADLDFLIIAVICTVPYCCRHSNSDSQFCFFRPESGELPDDCFCKEYGSSLLHENAITNVRLKRLYTRPARHELPSEHTTSDGSFQPRPQLIANTMPPKARGIPTIKVTTVRACERWFSDIVLPS